MKREVLKSLALKAKNRLIRKEEEDLDSLHIRVIENEDKKFYEKVCSLLKDNEDIINPIKLLMDDNVLMKLDARGRERYLLETCEKYHKCRKQFEESRAEII